MFLAKNNRESLKYNLILMLILVSTTYLFVLNSQKIIDKIIVSNNSVSSDVLSLVERSGFDDYGKFIYLASTPVIDSTQNFNSECNKTENTMSILGCFKDYKIYIYGVSDSNLDGIKEVTAAHEALHAAYLRLSSNDKTRLNSLLEVEYQKVANLPEYKERMEFYTKTEPGEKYNELHSMIGTEVLNISPELETYYSHYFKDRSQVVKLYEKYSRVFINLKKKADDLSAKIDKLITNIDSRTKTYKELSTQLNSDVSEFNYRANNGYFSSISQFNLERQNLISRSNNLENERLSINSDIENYNKMLEEYNSIATESNKLYSSIDSSLAPSPSL